MTETIETIYISRCTSLSGRSKLTYEAGFRETDNTFHLRIVANDGGGTWSNEWVRGQRVDGAVFGQITLTGTQLQDLFEEGQSNNNGGFLLAVLLDLGLVRINESAAPLNMNDARLYAHVPSITLEEAVLERIKERDNAPDEPALKPPSL